MTGDQLHSLARFARTPDGVALVEVLKAKLAVADGRLRVAKGEDLIQTQGRAQALSELIDDIVGAKSKASRNAEMPRARPRIASN